MIRSTEPQAVVKLTSVHVIYHSTIHFIPYPLPTLIVLLTNSSAVIMGLLTLPIKVNEIRCWIWIKLTSSVSCDSNLVKPPMEVFLSVTGFDDFRQFLLPPLCQGMGI